VEGFGQDGPSRGTFSISTIRWNSHFEEVSMVFQLFWPGAFEQDHFWIDPVTCIHSNFGTGLEVLDGSTPSGHSDCISLGHYAWNLGEGVWFGFQSKISSALE